VSRDPVDGRLMHGGDPMPLARADSSMHDPIVEMSAKRLGVIGVTDDSGHLVGVIDDQGRDLYFSNRLIPHLPGGTLSGEMLAEARIE
jgi:hypothetical protein